MDNYWLERTKRRLDKAEKTGLGAIEKILPIYDQALSHIDREVEKIYKTYSTQTGLDTSELKKVITGREREETIKKIIGKMNEAGVQVDELYHERYLARINRLKAMEQQIFWEVQSIANKEERIQESAYQDIIQQSYKTSREDLREYFNKEMIPFSMIDNTELNQMLREDWQGGNFSSRIWSNISILNQRIGEAVPRIIGGAVMSGMSYEKVSKQLQYEFGVGKSNAMRLVRTETNYFQNQAELQSYIDEGIEFYEYMAILDNRTSDICELTDGMVFRVKEAEAGFNYPPLHPNCRSSTKLIFKDEVKYGDKTVIGTDEWENRLIKHEEEKKKKTVDRVIMRWGKKHKDEDIEYSAIIDRETGKILAKNKGNYGEVNFNLKQWNEAEGNIIIHNHPYQGEPTNISAPDVSVAISKRAYEMVVVGKEGVYRLELGDLTQKSETEITEMANEVRDKYVERMKLLKPDNKSTENFNKKFIHDIAEDYNFKFIEEKFVEKYNAFKVDSKGKVELERSNGKGMSIKLPLTDREVEFIQNREYEFNTDILKGAGSDNGYFNKREGVIAIKSNRSDEDMTKTVFHELGHSIDLAKLSVKGYEDWEYKHRRFGSGVAGRLQDQEGVVSGTKEFKDLFYSIAKDGTYGKGSNMLERHGEETNKIVVNRYRHNLDKEDRGYDDSYIKNALEGIKIPSKSRPNYYLPTEKYYLDYLYNELEVFADGYAQYRLNPKVFKKECPNYAKFYEKILEELVI
jgi:SPP1 gp7 family putative phage head morphogenesis protein